MRSMNGLCGAGLLVLLCACGGSSPPPAQAGELSPLTQPHVSVTTCIPAALASQTPSDRLACLMTILDEGDLMLEMDTRESLRTKVASLLTPQGQERVDAASAEIDRLFDPQQLQATFEAKVAAGYDDAHGRRLLEFYASDLGTRYANATAQEDDARASEEWLENNPVSDARKAQLESLMTAVRGAEFVHAMLTEPIVSTIIALSPGESPEALAAKQAEAEQALQPIVNAVRDAVMGQYGYMLRDFDDASLTQIIAAEDTPEAKAFSALRLASLRAVLSGAYGEFGRWLAPHLNASTASQ